MKYLVIAAALALSACATKSKTPPEPVIQTVEVKVPVPVKCPALNELGAEPAYPDTDEALAAAPSLYERVRLLLVGRLMRTKRLGEYETVKNVCQK
jgi:hypothetical protein